MTLKEYQQEAVKFRTPESDNAEYLCLGLIAEVGEVAGKLAKKIRDGVFDEKAFIKELGDVLWFIVNLAEDCDKRDSCAGAKLSSTLCSVSFKENEQKKESDYKLALCLLCHIYNVIDINDAYLCEVLIYVGRLAQNHGYTLEQVAEINIAKLRDRQFRGVINGNGDER